jgi:hypothetical protein
MARNLVDGMGITLLFRYGETRADLTENRLNIAVPVRVTNCVGVSLDQALDSELARIGALLTRALRPLPIEVVESWIEDEQHEPVLDFQDLRASMHGTALMLRANWTVVCEHGFPQDDAWLTDWIRHLLLVHADG